MYLVIRKFNTMSSVAEAALAAAHKSRSDALARTLDDVSEPAEYPAVKLLVVLADVVEQMIPERLIGLLPGVPASRRGPAKG